jgi:hypothetical protein
MMAGASAYLSESGHIWIETGHSESRQRRALATEIAGCQDSVTLVPLDRIYLRVAERGLAE